VRLEDAVAPDSEFADEQAGDVGLVLGLDVDEKDVAGSALLAQAGQQLDVRRTVAGQLLHDVPEQLP
jgi:hypothetical protein